MNTVNLKPLYRSSVGFDGLDNLLNNALRGSASSGGYPPYDIEVLGNNQYAISLAVAGFSQDELEIQLEKNVLSVSGNKTEKNVERNFLHRGIANRQFAKKFNLADHVEVKGASLNNGLLTISLEKIIPETMKPRTITIEQQSEPCQVA